ncbi:restriction endonuclease subunit S [Escherichia coli]|uniref:restriction endonuclease subunit S n=1 Tax=Escherichia coli TaxID=562 RepID=UPI000D0AF261|nr:restriction endonuclease subunit S [Escherichia coli]EFA4826187.1 restriction endonuclease subunit S [Escherichia coli]MCH4691576.1 restriction endonuclease subunit S [Escherichia coli]MCK0650379.1 restriction endonuclease subunit S [Escherichia coli]MCK0655097.1 restriction endonuclease subunit S [Escherichia coli]MCK0660490.1 restriction endonuclease subunit S [Escherichia coli]
MSELSYLEKLMDGVEVEWKTLEDITLRTSNIKWREAIRSYRYIDLTSVDIATKKIIETTEITKNNAPSRAQKLVDENDVIFATTRPTQQRFCLIDSEYAGAVASTGYCILRAKKDQVLPKWILHWISTSDFKKHVEENQSGSAYPAISDSKVKECLIPIPCPDNPEKSLAIQSEIVRILDKFTALTAELTAELNMRKKQYNYYRDQLLSFEDGEVEWKALGTICQIGDGNHSSKYPKANEMIEQGIPFIRGTNMVNGTICNQDMKYISKEKHNELKKGHLKAFDVLIANRGEVGKVAYVPEGYSGSNLNSQLAWLRANPEIIINRYLFFILCSSTIQNKLSGEGGALQQLTIKNIKNIQIPVPSITVQSNIVSFLDKFDSLTNSISEGLPREIELRQKQYEYYRDLLFSFPKPDTVSN